MLGRTTCGLTPFAAVMASYPQVDAAGRTTSPTEGLVRGVERRWEGSLQVATAGDQGISGFASSRVGPSVASGWRLAVCKQGLVLVSLDASYFRPRNEVSVPDERCVAIRVSIFLTTGGSLGVSRCARPGRPARNRGFGDQGGVDGPPIRFGDSGHSQFWLDFDGSHSFRAYSSVTSCWTSGFLALGVGAT